LKPKAYSSWRRGLGGKKPLESRFPTERLRKLREALEGLKLEGYLVFHPANIHYFTGSQQAGELSQALLITPDSAILFLPEMGAYQVSRELKAKVDLEVSRVGEEALTRLRKAVQAFKLLGFDDASQARLTKLRVGGVKLKAHPEIAEGLRMVKDEGEIRAMRKAASILKRGFRAVLNVLKPGIREFEVAAEAEYALRMGGSDFYAFPSLVASGGRSAYPHGPPTSRKLRRGDVVVVDLGARFSGYCVDATRTFLIGEAKPTVLKAYQAVLEAYKMAAGRVRPGMSGSEADEYARRLLQARGFGEAFTHGLGHGVGLEVHEAPRLSPSSRDLLKAGSTFTLEPGVYLPGRFGIRVEDTFLLAEDGVKPLTGWVEKETLLV